MFKKLIVGKMGKIVFVFLCTFTFCLLSGKVWLVEAYDVTTEIRVSVGYWGEGYTKNFTATPEKLEAAGYKKHSEIYTWIDNKPAAGTTEAVGFYLSDILDYFKIHKESVKSYNFLTSDGHGDTTSVPASSIFAPRYTLANSYRRIVDEYLPYYHAGDLNGYLVDSSHYRLSNFYNMSDYRDEASYIDEAWKSKQEVKPMLALLKKNSRWGDQYPASLLDFQNMDERDGWTLFYGQREMGEVARNTMEKMVYKIAIWFNGSPSLSVNTNSIKGKIGSTTQVYFQMNTEDDFLSSEMAKDVRWVSDNPEIASVNPTTGVVTFNKEGEVDISAIYQKDGVSFSSTIRATGTKEKEKEKVPEDDPGSGNGSGDGSGDGSGGGIGSTNGTLNNHASGDLYVASSGGGSGNTDPLNTQVEEIKKKEQGTWKVYEMPVNKLQYKEDGNPLTIGVICIAIALLCAGGIGEGIRCYLQFKQPLIEKKC